MGITACGTLMLFGALLSSAYAYTSISLRALGPVGVPAWATKRENRMRVWATLLPPACMLKFTLAVTRQIRGLRRVRSLPNQITLGGKQEMLARAHFNGLRSGTWSINLRHLFYLREISFSTFFSHAPASSAKMMERLHGA